MRKRTVILIRVVAVVTATIAMLALATCGGSSHRVVQGFSPGSSQDSKTSPEGLDYPVEVSLDDALAQLDALATPDGVDEALFAELKDALREALIHQVESRLSSRDSRDMDSGLESPDSTGEGKAARKFVSTPPTGEANRVDDLTLTAAGGGMYDLTWHYRNAGDYDQNGTVGISDVTPIAIHFGEFADSSNEWIDGSSDGSINIADVTPLAINFGVDCAKYIIESSDSENGAYAEVDSVLLSLASGAGRKRFSHTLSLPPGVWVRVVPADSADEESTSISSNKVKVPAEGEELPVAALVAEPTLGDAPLDVSFDASGSFDPDGGDITQYEWDWEGDGTYDEDTGTVPTTSHIYGHAGTFEATVRVTDDDGSAATASETITVTGGSASQPPVASLAANPTSGDAPLPVDFDASESHDPDGGSIVKFEWDWDGDGTYDHESGTTPTAQHTYGEDGTYPAKVRVTDDEFTTATASVVITVGGGGTARGDWWMFGREPTHNRLSPFVGAQTDTVKWQFDTGGVVDSSPAIAADGTIYFGSFDEYIYALYPNGTYFWSYPTGGAVDSSPAIAEDGTIYVGSRDSYLYAINPDGTFYWRYETGDWVTSSPAIGSDGTIYVGSDDNYLYAINPDGTFYWRYETGGYVWSSPAISVDGTIYVGSNDHYLHAINPNGTFKWQYETGDAVTSSPAIASDGTIYVGSNDSYLYAINPDGTFYWRYKTGDAVESSPGIGADGTIYVGSDDDYLYAIYPNGTLKWKEEVIGDLWSSSPSIGADGAIYLSSYSVYGDKSVWITALNPDGSFKWRYTKETSLLSDSSAAIGPDGTVYIGCGADLIAFAD